MTQLSGPDRIAATAQQQILQIIFSLTDPPSNLRNLSQL